MVLQTNLALLATPVIAQSPLTCIAICPIIPDEGAGHAWHVVVIPVLEYAVDIESCVVFRPDNSVSVEFGRVACHWTGILCCICTLNDSLVTIPNWDGVTTCTVSVNVVGLRLGIGEIFNINFLLVVLVEEHP